MIVQIAGTNGSGKSTVVRRVMEAASEVAEDCPDDQLMGYHLRLGDCWTYLVGPYDVPTGGCDRIRTIREAHARVRAALPDSDHVLFEGAGHTMNQTQGPALVEELGRPFTVVLLTTPLGACLRGIDARRADRGQSALQDRRQLENNHVRARNYTARMRDVGARVIRATREEAPQRVLELLGG